VLASTLWRNAIGSSGEGMAKKPSEMVLQNLSVSPRRTPWRSPARLGDDRRKDHRDFWA
jgi:hypothetical protein